MNREIKFRVWDKKVYKSMFIVEGLGKTWVSFGVDDGEGGYLEQRKVEDVELMQYTGLLDKNGKEIYEGDVLYKFGIDDAPYEVKYGVQPISHEWLGIGFYTEHLGEMGNIFGGEEIEVIGNIYENPELLN